MVRRKSNARITPAAIPAFAPVERPFELGVLELCSFDPRAAARVVADVVGGLPVFGVGGKVFVF